MLRRSLQRLSVVVGVAVSCSSSPALDPLAHTSPRVWPLSAAAPRLCFALLPQVLSPAPSCARARAWPLLPPHPAHIRHIHCTRAPHCIPHACRCSSCLAMHRRHDRKLLLPHMPAGFIAHAALAAPSLPHLHAHASAYAHGCARSRARGPASSCRRHDQGDLESSAHLSLLHDISSQRTNVPFPHARRCSTASVVAVLIEFAASKGSCAFMEGQGLALSSFQRAPCSLSIEIKALAQLVSHTRSHPGGPGFEPQAPQILRAPIRRAQAANGRAFVEGRAHGPAH